MPQLTSADWRQTKRTDRLAAISSIVTATQLKSQWASAAW
jgi:hypothetical protein